MAIIKCPECGKEISDKAEKCPHCGVKIKKWQFRMFGNFCNPYCCDYYFITS